MPDLPQPGPGIGTLSLWRAGSIPVDTPFLFFLFNFYCCGRDRTPRPYSC
jgi:hypothetical protein